MRFERALQHIREGFLHDKDVRMGVLLPNTKQKHYVSYGLRKHPFGICDTQWYRIVGKDEITVQFMETLPVLPLWLFHEWFVEYPDGATFTTDETPIGEGISFVEV